MRENSFSFNALVQLFPATSKTRRFHPRGAKRLFKDKLTGKKSGALLLTISRFTFRTRPALIQFIYVGGGALQQTARDALPLIGYSRQLFALSMACIGRDESSTRLRAALNLPKIVVEKNRRITRLA
jgi:hypothetical protein